MTQLALVTFALSAVLVGAMRWYALRARVLDLPNERSSHATPTPRGGGLGLVAALVAGAGGAGAARGEPGALLAAVLAPVVAVAAVGWADDRSSLPVLPRLATHALAGTVIAAASVLAAPGTGGARAVGIALWCAWWALWTVSAINVVNFMDGIDGLIGSQTAIFGIHLAMRAADGSFGEIFAVALAAASCGFLVWNWAPARIFLGDVGSGALGVAAVAGGLLVLLGARDRFINVFLPLLPLFADASLTMVRRGRRGERLTTPHRLHLYQRLANGGWGHARVALLYAFAAAAGVLVASVAPRDGATAVAVRLGYAAAVVAVGLWLDRLVPPPPVADAAAAGE